MPRLFHLISLIALSLSAAPFITNGQVINFDVPGGAGAVNYSGQGAYPDPGNNYWNPIWGGKTTGATNLLSDGVTHSPITLTSELGGTYGTQGAQGTAAGLQQPYEYNNAVLQVDTLSNAPAGTYNLYLYGINNTGTRGTIFTVYTPLTSTVSLATSNTPASLTSFVQGADYVVFSNVVVGSAGTITFTWVGNPNTQLAGNNEGDLNALQLVYVSTNALVTNSIPNFGPNVLIFNPSMPMGAIQNSLNQVFASQQNNEFGTQRDALLFYPGAYSNLDVNLGYYTQVIGLGQMPDDATITGNVHSEGVLANNNATVNFWRCCENLAVVPANNNVMTWAVSQGTSLRRVHVAGNLNLSDTANGAYSSGGFLADSKVDATVSSITQQQWLSRNDIMGNWSGGVWNMVFVGVSNAPAGNWPNNTYTVITNTPLVREKPYLTESNNNFFVVVPNLETNFSGTTWANGPTPGTWMPIIQFYLAQPGIDNAGSINAALNAGQNLILTPGVYNLTNSITVTNHDTVILGLGYPTLVPNKGFPSLAISDVDGVKVAGIMFDAGTTASSSLLQVGTAVSTVAHSADPICLYDICSRVGGATGGTTTNCVIINANDVVGDNIWLWRADHGNGVGWTQNASSSGLVVNGDRVTIYGLFVEHHEKYQTLWNGNWGRVYFYQSELPYDAPTQNAWTESPGVNGYASYKVANSVTSHQAYGLGIYGVFLSSTSSCLNAIETPVNVQQVNMHDMITVCITAESNQSQITHIINGTGNEVGPSFATATANYLWQRPTFSISAGLDQTKTNFVLTLPTESWHTYQLQYINTITNKNWSNLGAPVGGDDTLEPVISPISPTNQFYRVVAK
ncbi:MAG TPA: hypothetical protein VMH87_20725 [Pseudomonadales bacterium]|nr:hypothetical protein [Pseudomonadales bacterium]